MRLASYYPCPPAQVGEYFPPFAHRDSRRGRGESFFMPPPGGDPFVSSPGTAHTFAG